MQRQPAGDLAIGVVGPHDLVERIMLSGTSPATPGTPLVPGGPGGPSGAGSGIARRLVAAAYRDEQEAADKVLRLGPVVDVCLFASPVPQEYARKAGVLAGPATCVPLNGSALYGALLRAIQADSYDLGKVSVDVLSRADIEDAYAEFGLPAQHVHIREDIGSAATLAAFHERLWRRGEITLAF